MDNYRILHIAQDDKFMNAACYLFEKAFPKNNYFVIVKPPANPPTRYLNEKVTAKSRVEVQSAQTVSKLLDLSSQADIVVLHGLDSLKGSLFLQSPNKNRFIAIVYGAEIYNRQLLGNQLLGIESKKLDKELDRTTLMDVIKWFYGRIFYRNSRIQEDVDIKEVLYKISVFGSLPGFSFEEHKKQELYNPNIKQVPFSYYPLEFIIKDEQLRAKGRDILLGNSASTSNNHLEALEILSHVNLEGRTIHVPLSYGNNKYAKALIKQGKKLFPDEFTPYTQFLPLEKYNQLMASCGVVIMNHYRPQAVGNIIAALYLGAKVLLNDTEIYRYFRRLGCHIYLIEESIQKQGLFELLNNEQINENRQILRHHLSTDALVKGMQQSFDELFNFSTGVERENKLQPF